MAKISFGVENCTGCVICWGSSSVFWLCFEALFCDRLFSMYFLNVLLKCLLFLYNFAPRSSKLSWVVSAVLATWLLHRMNSRCQALNVSSVFSNFVPVASLCLCLSSGCRLICSFLLSFFSFLDFPWVFQIFSFRFVLCGVSSRLLHYVIKLYNGLIDAICCFQLEAES
jgi:hypothetical protein